MRSIFRRLSALLHRSGSDRHALSFLNATQFCGAVNDNLFKLILVFFLIDMQGTKEASSILSLVGAVYVIPFLLFSSWAGVLADRFSKQRLLVIMKVAEMAIMVAALFAFGFQAALAGYCLLFLLSSHSALFGPSKYGIIAELVPKDRVSKANGLVTAFTYFAIIVGTFLASFLTDISEHNFVLVTGACLMIAASGFVSSLWIPYTPPQGSTKKLNPFFISEIYKTLRLSRETKHLFSAICGSAYFLFIGAFVQLNIIPFAIEALHLSEVAGGYLFLCTALGIGAGSFLAGKISKTRIELGLPCFASCALAIVLMLLAAFPTHLFIVELWLLLLGIFGGLFIVPFDTFIQLHSPSGKRGQMIAAGNFLSFIGVLCASFALYFLSEIVGLTAAHCFAVIGAITLVTALVLIVRLSDFSLSFLARLFIRPLFGLSQADVESLRGSTLLVLKNGSYCKALLLLSIIPEIQILLPCNQQKRFPWFSNFFYSFRPIACESSLDLLIEKGEALASPQTAICFLFPKELPIPAYHPTLLDALKLGREPPLFIEIEAKLFRSRLRTSVTLDS